MATRIFFNGREYPTTAAMPDDVRKAYEQALAQLVDTNRNGIPDILERPGAGNVIGIQQCSITVNGRTYESVDQMPALVRLLYEYAMGKVDAKSLGLPPTGGAIPGANTPPWSGLRSLSSPAEEAGAGTPPGGRPATVDVMRVLDGTGRFLERAVQFLLLTSATGILTGAIFLMLHMDGASRAKERLYVAIIALLLLGTLDTQAQRLIRRRTPFSLTTPVEVRRYSGVSLLLLLVAGGALFGLALFLP